MSSATGTVTGTGSSTREDAAGAAADATSAARERLGGRQPAFGFVFVAPRHDLDVALATASDKAGTPNLIGCTTAGEITESGLTHDGVAVMLVAANDVSHRVAYSTGMKGSHDRVATELYQGFGDAKRDALASGRRNVTTVVLTDGLAGTGEQLVGAMLECCQGPAQIVGGAAGDEAKFKGTHVGARNRAAKDAAAAIHVFDAKPWGVGVNHGLRSTTKPMRVTKARDNVVFELDNVPAFEVYRRHAASRGIQLTRDNAGAYMIGNELGMHFFDKITRARAPLSVGSDGSLTCAAAIPSGSLVSILDGEPDSMISAAQSAAAEARERLGDSHAAGVLLFDCVCRGMILKDQFQREIDAVRSVFGEVPVAGFLTYGEIARYTGKLEGWHNATAVVVAIPG